eukprot:Awhi_evm2s170
MATDSYYLIIYCNAGIISIENKENKIFFDDETYESADAPLLKSLEVKDVVLTKDIINLKGHSVRQLYQKGGKAVFATLHRCKKKKCSFCSVDLQIPAKGTTEKKKSGRPVGLTIKKTISKTSPRRRGRPKKAGFSPSTADLEHNRPFLNLNKEKNNVNIEDHTREHNSDNRDRDDNTCESLNLSNESGTDAAGTHESHTSMEDFSML